MLEFEAEHAERRRNKRVRFREPVYLHAPEERFESGCLAQDISESGIRLSVNEFLPLEAQLDLSVRLSPGITVDCVGEIRWVAKTPHCERYQVGVRFSEEQTEPQAKYQIKNYLSSANFAKT